MELKKIFVVIQHWLWLLIIGILLGASIAFFISSRQTKAYQSSTRVQVMSAPLSGDSVYAYFNDQQLAKTYSQTLVTRPILNLVENRLGIPVSAGQIRIRTVAETQLIDINVEYNDPQSAANIANTLVSVFVEENNKLQASRFLESEQSLQAQIDQVDEQIRTLQSQSLAVSSAQNEETLSKAKAEMATLEGQILALQGEIFTLENPPTPYSWVVPTIAPEDQNKLNEKKLRLEQLQNIYNLYQQIYTNLIVLGSASAMSGSESNANGGMQSTLALYEQIRSNLLASYEDVRLARLNSTSNIVQIEPAIPNSSPIRPQTSRNVGLGAAVGLLIVAALVFLLEYLDDTVKTAEQITEKFNIPVIGYISTLSEKKNTPYVSSNPRSPIAEAFRTLRTNIEFSGVDKPIRSLLVVSPNPSEGKSTVASNLAVSMAQGGKRALLIDADLRRPRIHHLFGMQNRVGLSNLFRSQMRFIDVIQKLDNPNLLVITSGKIPPNPADLLGSKRMAEVLAACKEAMDITIVDAPPFLVSDASILASRMDAVVLVVHSGKTTMDSLVTTIEQMERAGARIIGIVMNRIPRNHSYYYGGYRFYSSRYIGKYYRNDEEIDQEEGKPETLLQRIALKFRSIGKISLNKKTKKTDSANSLPGK